MVNEPPIHPETGEPVTPEQLIEANDKLTEVLHPTGEQPAVLDLSGFLTRLDAQQRLLERQRRQSRGIVALAVTAIVLAGIGAWVATRVDHNTREIAKATAFAEADASNLRILCEKGNDDNAKRKALWQFVLDTLKQSPTAQPEFIEGLTRLVDQAYAQNDCNPTDATPPGSAASVP